MLSRIIGGSSPTTAEWNSGSRIFFNHSTEAWIPGEVVDVEVNRKSIKYLCKSDNGAQEKVGEADLFRLIEGWDSALNDDLLDLPDLHESTMLHCTKNRYLQDKIYVCNIFQHVNIY
jgi:myosin heavy subunit